MKKFIIDGIKDFDLDHIFDCGQCFRWEKEEDGSYTGVAKGKAVNIDYDEGRLIIDNASEEDFNDIWYHYLDLDTDYGKIKRSLSRKDKVIKKVIKSGEGIRILNQDIWETIVSFIISANNNIPRIKGGIELLCENFGKPLGEYRGKDRFAFPSPEKISSLSEENLDICRLGYRSKYIIATAKKYLEDRESYENLVSEKVSTEEAFNKIKELSGVGPKVANCITLFSLKKRDSFPIDVWMKRVMNRLYGIDENNFKEMELFAKENFGNKAGIAQQYLFYYMRNNEEK